ncbi:MAG TPA: hypothetical protein VM511_03915, partial [Luteolibacter sp.]|nr:hypothetical protein [Luteolibacter sp.]
MKPIPAHDFADTVRSYPPVQPTPPQRNDSPSNFRRPQAAGHRSYPFLLIASTLVASVFCFLYITKPVVQVAGQNAPKDSMPVPETTGETIPASGKTTPAAAPALMPGSDRLPGDKPSATPPIARKDQPAFEETNLTVQHVLTARVAEGDISRLVLDVPVLYQSRHLKWTQGDVEHARKLLAQLSDYQEKSVLLRSEGTRLLSEWNQLVTRSIPAAELRADSPSLPGNQRSSAPSVAPTGL